MSEILQMSLMPILNIRDFYQYFDVLDMLRNRAACARFASGHFRWSGSLNLHHLDVLERLENPAPFTMTSAADYWAFRGPWGDKLLKSIESYNQVADYESQARTAESIFNRLAENLTGPDRPIVMLVIAGILLAGRDASCLDGLNAKAIKRAYHWTEQDAPAERNGQSVVVLSLTSPDAQLCLHQFNGFYQIPYDPSLCPSRKNRLKVWRIQSDSETILEFADTAGNAIMHHTLHVGEQMYCLVLEHTVVRVLPNRVQNGHNILFRKADGIYLNNQRYPVIPQDASSFAVGADPEDVWSIFVRNGQVHYINYDEAGLGQKAPEEITVIAEVRLEEGKPVIVRNDGRIWNENRFIDGGDVNG